MNLRKYFNQDELAASVWTGKYAAPGETTPDDMHRRMAKEFARIEEKYQEEENKKYPDIQKNLLSEYGYERGKLDIDSIYELFKDFKYIVPQGSVMASLGIFNKISSLSNCFVIGQPEDSYGGIMYKDQEMAQLMKRRGGVGLDLSTLAPKGRLVKNAAATSTGAASFMHRYSNTTREVAQDGRRGALMLTMDCRHPDIFDFVNAKKDRTKVTGANISVMLRDDFMEAVKNDEDYLLQFPCHLEPSNKEAFLESAKEYDRLYSVHLNSFYPDGLDFYYKKIKAKELYDSIVENAWENAEPGQMFIDTHWNYSPDSVYPEFKMVTTNPCGEIGMGPYDACRLIALNLFSYVVNPFTDEAYFDFKLFYKHAYEQRRLGDNLVDLELEHIDRILDKIGKDPEDLTTKLIEINLWNRVRNITSKGRRTGCGFTALGDTLAALGVKYDSVEAKSIIEDIMSTKFVAEQDCGIDLAILRGPFEGWSKEKEFTYIPESNSYRGENMYYERMAQEYPAQTYRMYQHGRRGISDSTVAPTGSLSILTQTTSGIEPLFQPFYTRRKKVNPNDTDVRVDFTDDNGDTWMEYSVLHPKFKDWCYGYFNAFRGSSFRGSSKAGEIIWVDDLTPELAQIAFEESPWYGSTANDIDWISRVEIQAIIQKYTTHSISSTINLPNDVTKEEVGDIYMSAHHMNLKGVTVYRDGCRTGVLVNENKENEFSSNDAPKRPESLDCDVHHTSTSGQKYTVLVGLFENKPYELFIIPGTRGKTDYTSRLTKIKSGEYDLEIQNGTEKIYSDITHNMTDEQAVITRLISTSLRHGADIKFIVEQIGKTHGDIFSFTKVISRILKKYIPDGEKSTVKCLECDSKNVVFQEGCQTCMDCGSSRCG